jgi:phosphoribosyl-ATP pyrophosphohydrolase/phosphoribosyl-AMP cyclohydrolase
MNIRVDLPKVSFNSDGLVPVITQDVTTGRVLMLAWMNEEAISLTIDTKHAVYFSRSRNELWHKGKTSGNTQLVKKISFDCDSDAILLSVIPAGPACHNGLESCFDTTVYDLEDNDHR